MIDWRALLDELSVEWKDRGANTARGRVNLKCPYCWDDPSQHLTIAEASGRWYCYRDSSHYGGPVDIVSKLLSDKGERRPRVRAVTLLDDHEIGDAMVEVPARTSTLKDYDSFEPAWNMPSLLGYLDERGFAEPFWTARYFNLRGARNGPWSRRLLLPLLDREGEIAGWTGRAIDGWRQPRYKSDPPGRLTELMAGDLRGGSLVVVEGPLDALKFNTAMVASLGQISAVAVTGLLLSAARINAIRGRPRRRIWVALDRGTRQSLKWWMIGELGYGGQEVVPLELPDSYKDFGDMPESEIREYMGALLHHGTATVDGSVRELG